MAKPPDEYRPSKRTRRLLDQRGPLFKQEIERLSATERRELQDLALGKVEGAPDWARLRAMNSLASVGGAREVGILREMIADRSRPREIRALAASTMSLVPHADAETALVASLDTDDDLVQTRVIQAIGRIGGQPGFDALQELGEPASEAARKQLAFAKTLIAYRLDLDEEPMAFGRGLERKRNTQPELLTLSVRRIRAKKVGATRNLLEGSEYGIEIHDRSGFEVTVGRARWILLLNAQAAKGGLVRSLGRKKMLLGLMARYARERGTFSTQYVVLTRPTDDGKLLIQVVRTDGEPFYTGSADTTGGRLSFTISDIDRPGTAPTKVRGTLGARGLRMDVALAFGSREGKRQTKPIELGQ